MEEETYEEQMEIQNELEGEHSVQSESSGDTIKSWKREVNECTPFKKTFCCSKCDKAFATSKNYTSVQ